MHRLSDGASGHERPGCRGADDKVQGPMSIVCSKTYLQQEWRPRGALGEIASSSFLLNADEKVCGSMSQKELFLCGVAVYVLDL